MTNPSAPGQLALALAFEERLAREDFLEAPCNTKALALIERWPDWADRAVGLVGPEGCGKSHLVAIWAARAQAKVVPGNLIRDADVPEMLSAGALAVEDLPHGTSEQALLHLINLAREQKVFLLLSARTLPAVWPVGIRDLGSRLRAVPVTTLERPDDDLLRAVLIKLFVDRGLAVEETLITYLLSRIERSFAAVRVIVSDLDREALRLKRPVTRALAAEALDRLGARGPSDAPE
jgi:chromosomal replication initiation ATPase DnaA